MYLFIFFSILTLASRFLLDDPKGLIFGIYVLSFIILVFIKIISSKRISEKIKTEYPVLYEKYKGRSYLFSDLHSVEYFKITKDDLQIITNSKLRGEIIYNKEYVIYNFLILIITTILYSILPYL